MTDLILRAITALDAGDERQKAMGQRLHSILDASVVKCHELLLALVEIRIKRLLPDDATLCLILEEVDSASDTAAKEVVGYGEDFELECDFQTDELASAIIKTIEDFLRSRRLPHKVVQNAIDTATERFDQSLLGPTYGELFKKEYSAARRRYLNELRCEDILALLDQPETLSERRRAGERLLMQSTPASGSLIGGDE